MQFKRNRRLMLAQDIVLVCMIFLIFFFCIGSLRIGPWYTGDTFTVNLTATELSEDWTVDFYQSYVGSDGDELGDAVSFSPLSIWKAIGRGSLAITKGILHRTVTFTDFGDMPAEVFDDSAELLMIFHLIGHALTDTVYQGLVYLALFCVTAILPLIVMAKGFRALADLISRRKEPRERHRLVVLSFRRAILPLFTVLMLTLLLPETTPALAWVWAMGLYLLCVVWNLIASRVKRNTGNEKEYLNFIQFFSLGGLILMIAALVALDYSGALRLLYDRILYADGVEIILDCFGGDFDVPKLLMLIFIALFLAGIGLTVRYLYYGLLRVACLLESTRHKKVHNEGLVAVAAVALVFLASSYFLFEASGRMELVMSDEQFIGFLVSLGLVFLVLVVEILQRVFCYANRLDRAYRNDLLCGCTDDRMYSVEAVIADEGDNTPTEEASAEEASAEEASAEEVSAEEAPIAEAPIEEASAEEASAEEASAEEASAEEASAEEMPTEEVSAEEMPTEKVSTEKVSAEEASAEEAPTEEVSAEEVPAEEASAEEAPIEEASAEEMPIEEAPIEEAPIEEASAEEAPIEEASAEEMLTEEASAEEAPAEEAPIEEASAEETPVTDESIT